MDRLRETVIGPPGAQVDGMRVQTSLAKKRYVCPYCNGAIEVGVRHVVAYPDEALDDRRHFHTPCWSKKSKGSRKPIVP